MAEVARAARAALRRAHFAASALGIVLAALAHAASLAGVVVEGSWVLHVGVVIVALPVVAGASTFSFRKRLGLREILKGGPPWAMRAVQLAFLYFLGQFAVLLLVTRGRSGGPARPPMTADEARMFSAGWFLVYLICALATWPRPRSGAEGGRGA